MDKQTRIDQLEAAIARLRGQILPDGQPQVPEPTLGCPHFGVCWVLSIINELESIVDELRQA